jgi:hypothetical protein
MPPGGGAVDDAQQRSDWEIASDLEPGIFSYYNKQVEIRDSARKHGVADQEIVHAIDNALAIEDAGEDPDR